MQDQSIRGDQFETQCIDKKQLLCSKKLQKSQRNLENQLKSLNLNEKDELNKQLQQQGFKNFKLNCKVLKKCNGNLEEAIKLLNVKKGKLSQKIQSSEYQLQYQELEKKFCDQNPKKILKFLKIFKGDIEKVSKILSSKQCNRYLKKKEEKQIEQRQEREEEKRQNSKRKRQNYQKDSNNRKYSSDEEESDISDKMVLIFQQGFKQPMMVYRALKKSNGHTQQAIQHLERGKKKDVMSELQEKYPNQSQQLIAQGFMNPKKNIKALEKCAGDYEQALNLLTEKHKKKEKYEVKQEMNVQEYSQIQQLYIDGNNLLFVDESIRKILLQEKDKKKVEKIIQELVRSTITQRQFSQTTLVFDNLSSKKTFEEELNFKIESARPEYQTSDDYLVDKSQVDIQEKDLEQVLFVTSDKGLIKRLKEKRIKFIMRSGQFFDFMKKIIGIERYSQIIQQKY